MQWGEWMVPKLSLSAEAQLMSHIAAIRNDGPSNVAGLVDATCSLVHQNAMQAAIIRQATLHIAELEMREALASRGLPVRLEHPAPVQRGLR